VTDVQRILLVAALGAAAMLARVSIRAARLAAGTPQRLIAQLRVAQLGAALLLVTAGASVGLAVAHETDVAASLDIGLSVGFAVLAAAASLREPAEAITWIAAAFAAHAVFDTLHRPGFLSADMSPRWYLIGCAVYDLLVAFICYVPLLRRTRA
jgi:hypothetical protein